MRKIPTIFERDWNGDRSRVLDIVHPGCEWVLAGEGVATQKLDGTCCLVRDGKLFKRREIKPGGILPPDFELADSDDETGRTVGWVPVGSGPEDKWHRAAAVFSCRCGSLADGTYELIGPNIQGNPERSVMHQFVNHRSEGLLWGVPIHQHQRNFDGIRALLSGADIEGLVFHHPDGRMAKIKLRDFGFRRGGQ